MALRLHWSLLDPRATTAEVAVEEAWINPDALDGTFFGSAFHVSTDGKEEEDGDSTDGVPAAASGGALARCVRG